MAHQETRVYDYIIEYITRVYNLSSQGRIFFTFCVLSWNKIRDMLLITTTVHTFRRINLYLSCCKKKNKTKKKQRKMINLHIKCSLFYFLERLRI